MTVKDKRVKMLVNSCIRGLDNIRMRRSRKSSAEGLQERRRHTFSKFRKVVTMKISIEEAI